MNIISIWQQALIISWGEIWTIIFNIVPSLLGALTFIALGLTLSYWVKKLTVDLLRTLKIDRITKFVGINDFLVRVKIKSSFIEITGTIINYFLILVFFLSTLQILGLSSVTRFLGEIFSYLPHVFSATLILSIGYVIAILVENITRTVLFAVNHKAAKLISGLTKTTIVATSFFASIKELQIPQGLTNVFYQGFLYIVVLVVGLSVGLGSKDVVSRVLNDWYDKIRK